MELTCFSCGKRSAADAAFCSSCGVAISRPSALIAAPVHAVASATTDGPALYAAPFRPSAMAQEPTLDDRLANLREKVIALPRAAKIGAAGVMIAVIAAAVAVAVEYQASPMRPTFPSVSGPATYAADSGPFPTSFDCGSTTDWADQMVCHQRSLAQADVRVDAAYSTRLDDLDDAASRLSLQAEQGKWLARRDGCIRMDDPALCLELAYNSRIIALQSR